MSLFGLFTKRTGSSTAGRDLKSKSSGTAGINVIDHSDNLEAQIVPIEKRIKHLKPVAEGLYAHEVLMLSYADKYHLSGDDYPGFWWWRYGIKDVHGILNSLLARGFLHEGDEASALKTCTAAELRDFLKSQGLKVSGKKDDLIKRILTEVNRSSVRDAFPNRTYALTERGRKVLGVNSAIVEAHKNPEMRIWDVPASALNRPPKTNDERWGEMNASYLKHMATASFGLAANTRLRMAELLADEGRYADALSSLCAVMAIDLSGVGNNFNKETFLSVGASLLFPYEKSVATIPPGVLSLAVKWQRLSGLDNNQLQALLLRGFEEHGVALPISIFTPEESLAIFNMECSKDTEGLSRVYKAAKRRFHKRYPSANLRC